MSIKDIDWTKQHCGIYQGELSDIIKLMPDVLPVIDTFPDNPNDFIWDIKIHMLMPDQYPCIPNWHYDNIPRDKEGKQDFTKIKPEYPMYVWVSGNPVTIFKVDNKEVSIPIKKWYKFNQKDYHTGTVSKEFCWRCFIRATHKEIAPPRKSDHNPLRRHSQVYLDASNFTW